MAQRTEQAQVISWCAQAGHFCRLGGGGGTNRSFVFSSFFDGKLPLVEAVLRREACVIFSVVGQRDLVNFLSTALRVCGPEPEAHGSWSPIPNRVIA